MRRHLGDGRLRVSGGLRPATVFGAKQRHTTRPARKAASLGRPCAPRRTLGTPRHPRQRLSRLYMIPAPAQRLRSATRSLPRLCPLAALAHQGRGAVAKPSPETQVRRLARPRQLAAPAAPAQPSWVCEDGARVCQSGAAPSPVRPAGRPPASGTALLPPRAPGPLGVAPLAASRRADGRGPCPTAEQDGPEVRAPGRLEGRQAVRERRPVRHGRDLHHPAH
jgi:hypothetical protein